MSKMKSERKKKTRERDYRVSETKYIDGGQVKNEREIPSRKSRRVLIE